MWTPPVVSLCVKLPALYTSSRVASPASPASLTSDDVPSFPSVSSPMVGAGAAAFNGTSDENCLPFGAHAKVVILG